MSTKPFWASKTIWANIVMILAAVFAEIDGRLSGQISTAAIVVAVANIILRTITTMPISVFPEENYVEEKGD